MKNRKLKSSHKVSVSKCKLQSFTRLLMTKQNCFSFARLTIELQNVTYRRNIQKESIKMPTAIYRNIHKHNFKHEIFIMWFRDPYSTENCEPTKPHELDCWLTSRHRQPKLTTRRMRKFLKLRYVQTNCRIVRYPRKTMGRKISKVSSS